MLVPLQNGVEILHNYFPVVEAEDIELGRDLDTGLKPVAIGTFLFPPMSPAQKQQLDHAMSVNDARRTLKTVLSRANELVGNKSPATMIRNLYALFVGRVFDRVQDAIDKLAALVVDVPELTRETIALALTRDDIRYPILKTVNDPEEGPQQGIGFATLKGYSGPVLNRDQLNGLFALGNFLSGGFQRSFRLGLLRAESHFGRGRSGAPGSATQIQQYRNAIAEYPKLIRASLTNNLEEGPFTVPNDFPPPDIDLGQRPRLSAQEQFVLIRLAFARLALGDALFRRSFQLSEEARVEIVKQYVIAMRLLNRSRLRSSDPLRGHIRRYAVQQHAKVESGQNFLGYRDSYVPDRSPSTLADLADNRIQAAIRTAESFVSFKTNAEKFLADLAEMEQNELEKESGIKIANLQVGNAEARVVDAGATISEIEEKRDGLGVGLAADLTKSVFVTAALGATGVSFEAAEANLSGVFSSFVSYQAAKAEAEVQLRAAQSEERMARRDRDIANLELDIANSRKTFLEDAIEAKVLSEFNSDRLFALANVYQDMSRRHVDAAFELLYLYERTIEFRRLKSLQVIQPDLTAVDPVAAGEVLNAAFLDLNEERKEDGPGQDSFPLQPFKLRARYPLEFARFLQDRSMEFVISLYDVEKLLSGTANVRIKQVRVELRPNPLGGFQGKLIHRGVTLVRDREATLNPPSRRLVPRDLQLQQAIADLESGRQERVVVEGVVPMVLGENRLLISSEPEQPIPGDDGLFDLQPIENFGLPGTWRLQIDPLVDLRGVTDVVLHFTVSVPQPTGALETHILNLIEEYEVELADGGELDRILTVPLRQRFPATFDELEFGPGSFELREQDFPDGITDLRVQAIVAQSIDTDGKGVSGVGFEVSKPGTPLILTRTTGADGFSEDLSVDIPPIPQPDRPDIQGVWQVRLLDPGQFSSLNDLLLFFVYTFRTVPVEG